MAGWAWLALPVLMAAQGVVSGAAQNGSGSGASTAAQSAQVSLTLTPRTLDFGAQAVGSTSAALSGTVKNSTNTALTVTDVIPSGIDFRETNDCGGKLEPGASCAIQVKFTPAISGPREGTVTILDSVSARPATLVLNGVGQ